MMIKTTIISIIIFMAFYAMAFNADAANRLIVVRDYSKEGLKAKPTGFVFKPPTGVGENFEVQTTDIKVEYPKATMMKPGKLKEIPSLLNYPPMNIAVLGDDAFSNRWFKSNEKQLAEQQVVLLLVNTSQEHTKKLKDKGFDVVFVDDMDLNQSLNIKNYPFKIINNKLTQ